MRSNTPVILDDFDIDSYEWINGERVPLNEYEARLQNQAQYNAGLFLLSANSDLNWIFGIEAI
jgi:hypothetical protein